MTTKEPNSLRLFKLKSEQWRERVLSEIKEPTFKELKEFLNVFLVWHEKTSKRTAKIFTYKKYKKSIEEIGKEDKNDISQLERKFKKIFNYNLEADRITLMDIKEKHLPEVLNKYKISDPETARNVKKGIKRKKREFNQEENSNDKKK